ncbi:hypothetical protein [Larkinella terrae]|uniref:Uncharacterized protein n=1 Tax=Larkinella terrae TaxID=2025311 RepID=A0A7K0EQY4_9BACT|nr:hypothetical protein [Larkinella terrae]MRS64223.1 hypothetical protein [Larkinella terrae]
MAAYIQPRPAKNLEWAFGVSTGFQGWSEAVRRIRFPALIAFDRPEP